MEIEVTKIKGNADGSATVELQLDNEALTHIIQKFVIDAFNDKIQENYCNCEGDCDCANRG